MEMRMWSEDIMWRGWKEMLAFERGDEGTGPSMLSVAYRRFLECMGVGVGEVWQRAEELVADWARGEGENSGEGSLKVQ